MNDITKKELQEIQEQLKSIMQYGLADKLQNIIDDNSIPVDKPVKMNFAEDIRKMKDAQLKSVDEVIKSTDDKIIKEVHQRIKNIVNIIYNEIIEYVSKISA